jgi:5-methylthioadenosine/S-adenosylhomocysteine deaminase
LIINEGKIEAVLSAVEADSLLDGQVGLPHENLAGCVVTPGLFNLHTHLDYTNLAHLQSFAGATMFDWLEDLVAQSRSTLSTSDVLGASALAGAREAALAGTTFIVDSTFSGAAAGALAEVGLKGLVGLELFGLDGAMAEMLFQLWLDRLNHLTDTAGGALQRALQAGQIRLTVAPHAPYTVSPALWRLAGRWAREKNLPITCHLAESVNEFNWIESTDDRLHQYLFKVMPRRPVTAEPGAGAVMDPDTALDHMLKTLPWRGHGQSPTAHLDEHGLLDERTIAAHCLKLGPGDIERLAARKVKIALCPRSNVLLKNGLPRPAALLQAGITCGLGTDSRASSPSLSLLAEARYLHGQLSDNQEGGAASAAPSATKLLSMLTRESAHALGLGAETGALTVGRRADIAAFKLPQSVQDASADTDGAPDAKLERLIAALFDAAPNCRMVFVDGKAIVRDGQLV